MLEIGKIIYSWDDEEIVAIQPLLNWLRAANCKERQTQRSRIDTPVTATWIPTFPNGEEINWATERLSRTFGTNYRVNVNMGINRSRTSTNDDNRKRKYSETDHTAKAIAAIMGYMGMSKQKETPNQVISVSTTDKMGKNRQIRLKGWCGIHDGIREPVPEIWKELEDEQTKEDRLDRLVRAFSPEETEDDTVDINIDDRLGTCIIKGRFGAGMGYSYRTCHHGLTIFATAPKGSEESAEQQLADDAQRLATTKTVADVEKSRGKPPPIATDYYTLLAWIKNYMIVLKVLFGKKCPLLINHEAIRNTIVMVRRRNNNYFF